jgi:phosphoenolpyruvate carboxylase
MEISETIHLLGDILGQVLVEQESQALFEVEERIRTAGKQLRSADQRQAQEGSQTLAREIAALDMNTDWVIASAFALYFDLVNTAEDLSRIDALRKEALEKDPAPVHDSIEEAVAQLKNSSVSQEKMAGLLEQLQIELVLTGHPTEARRRTILSKIQRISEALKMINKQDALPDEIVLGKRELREEVTTLWLTDRARTSQPPPADEVKTTLYFVGQVFWSALPEIYARMERALDRYYPGLHAPGHTWLRLASWIGGDRDGNPNVTAEVTADTLHLHRGLAIENHRRSLQDLSRRLSVSSKRAPLPETLQIWLEKRKPYPPHAAQIQARYPMEPYRLILALLAADLAEASQDDMKAHLLSPLPHTAHVYTEGLSDPLSAIAETLPQKVVEGKLSEVLRQVNIFELHGARLDLREDATRIHSALAEVLRGLGISAGYESAEAGERQEQLLKLLEQPVPPLADRPGISPKRAETWALFRLIQRTRALYGKALLGPLILSMTHSPADVLAALLMARWSGCDEGLQIVPLFETIQDLETAPQIMQALFSLPRYRKHLATCPDGQMVMVGYSDSNKDGGYLMASWALYQAQEGITRVCREAGIDLTLFHGRGGTAARGGGPVNRAILAQPGGSVEGRLRVTEQGEILSSRYSNIDLALRNLEQIVNAVLLASAPQSVTEPSLTPVGGHAPLHFKLPSPRALPPPWRETMDVMAVAAQKAYRDLVYGTPGFMDYWRAVTPIEEIKELHIGSRPASRKPGEERLDNIRAIPWVFSWMQSRYNLPGWYGLGSGLEAVLKSRPAGLDFLQAMHSSWSFFRTLLETAELSLMKADMGVAAIYSELAPDREKADQIFSRIQAEYERTVKAVLAVKGQHSLMEDDRVIQRSVIMRNPYVDPLNYLQVEMLRRLRELSDSESEEGKTIREVVVLTINGIAAGLRNTG